MAADSDSEDWPWDQAPGVAALTVASILAGSPILHVSHDADDHGWQFLDGAPVDEGSARAIAMRTAVRLDPAVVEVADLPPGWIAWRERPGAPWSRAPHGDDAEPGPT